MPIFAGDRALVIGVDDYAVLGPGASLTGAAGDAQRFAAFLNETAGFDEAEISLLTDSAATSGAVMDTLIDRIVGETAPGDRVVLYFAGMGTVVAGPDGQPQAALLAHDADSPLGAMPHSVFADMLALISDRRISVVIDAGFAPADPLLPGLRSRFRPAEPAESETTFGGTAADHAVWTAGQPGTAVIEGPQGGAFTSGLLAAATGGARDLDSDSTISASEILSETETQMVLWCAGHTSCATSGATLRPALAGQGQGLFGLSVSEPAPASLETPDIPAVPPSLAEALAFTRDLLGPNNAANLVLKVHPAATLTIGEIVEFSVSSDRTGSLLLLDIGADGAVTPLFPSALAGNRQETIAAGETLTLPSGSSTSGQPLRIRVSGPAGSGFLLGILVEETGTDPASRLPVSAEASRNAGLYVYELAQSLIAREAAGELTWSAAYFPYEITP
ncbi:MAG: DUF4384 domain-containing protein [Pseudomonadota bacterium]